MMKTNRLSMVSCKTRADPLRTAVHQAVVADRRRCLHATVALTGLVGAFLAPQAAAGLFAAETELSTLQPANGGDGSTGFVINGIDIVDEAGHPIRSAGDVNGDGIDDLLIAAPNADPGGRSEAGEVYIVFGSDTAFAAEFELSSLLPANGGDGSKGVVLNGDGAGTLTGSAIAGAGDINGDGVGDIIIGADRADPANEATRTTRGGGPPPFRTDAGIAYVVFGTDAGYPAVIELSSLLAANGGDGSAGFVLEGVADGDGLGISVDGLGDIDDDGFDDLIVGARSADGTSLANIGESYVVFGSDQPFPAEIEVADLRAANGGDGSVGFTLPGTQAGERTGSVVSRAGDVNGDGVVDALVCAGDASPGARYGAGRCYLVFGRATGFPADYPLADLFSINGGDGSAGVVLNGIDAGDEAGSSASGAGDLNGDGFADIVIGAVEADPAGRSSAGETYVVFGTNSGFPAEIELSSLMPANGGDGTDGFVLNGAVSDDYSGYSVAAAGDVNGDGFDDLIIGANGADPGAREYAGQSFVLFGTDQGFAAEIELSAFLSANGGDGTAGFVLNGIDESDYSGVGVHGGDINGDGISDLIVSADDADPGGRIRAGETYVFFGRADTDSDGVPDASDNCPHVANADQADGDGDTVGDACDNCRLESNPDQCNTDGDDFGNLCDADLDGNNIVNSFDLGIMREVFGTAGASDADLDCDDTVNTFDLTIMREKFGQPPGPGALAPPPAAYNFAPHGVVLR